MKICIVSDYFYPVLGGITEHVYNLSKYSRLAGHNVTVLTPAPLKYSLNELKKIDQKLLDGNVLRIGRHLPVFSNDSLSRAGIAWNIKKKLTTIFEEYQFDVIHSHSPLAGFIPMMALKYSNTKTIGTMHTYFQDNMWFNLFKKTLTKYYDAMDGCISVSESSKELIYSYLKRTPTVIHNGIDVNIFGNTSKKIPAFVDDKINIFFIGRAETRNGIDVLIKAFLTALKINKKLRLIISGDGPYLQYYKDMVPMKNKNDVVFTGRIYEERPVYYNTADIHVFPAEIATFSITVLEGLAAGKPVISTDMTSFKEIMTDGQEGYLVKYGDYKTMARKILDLASDKDLRIKMGKAARERALKFSWETITEKVIKFYNNCNNNAS